MNDNYVLSIVQGPNLAGTAKIKKQVEEAREVAAERQEIVKRYMKMREEQMRRDACIAREELNARVIEVCNY